VRTHDEKEAFVLANKLGSAFSHTRTRPSDVKLTDSRIAVFTAAIVDSHSLEADHGIRLCMRVKVDICGDRKIVHAMQSLYVDILSPGARAFSTEIRVHWRVGRHRPMRAAQRDQT
jgi:hypothetical protein